MVYLDWNATAPLAPEVVEAQRDALGRAWANPASVHGAGRSARLAIEEGRRAVAALLAVDPRDVVLTSGGTEANNLALSIALVPSPGVLVTSRLEHPSITRTAEALAERGVEVVWLPTPADGAIRVEDALAAVEQAGPRCRLVSVAAVNHETGVVQPVAALAARLAGRTLLHCDAVQALGRVDPALYQAADLISLAGHKLRGPKGVGALGWRRHVDFAPPLHGGAQERGLRPGTQDPVLALGLAAACARAARSVERWAALAPLRDRLERTLVALGAEPNGTATRAPHVSHVSFPGWSGAELAAALDLEGVAISSGAACSAGTAEPSPGLTAMLGAARAQSAVRVSLGETTTAAEVDTAIDVFSRVIARQRAAGSNPANPLEVRG